MSENAPHEIMRELGCPGPHSAVVLAENRGKCVWRIQGDGKTFALRMLRSDEHETALAERQAMDSARARGAPVPEVLATGTWNRRPVILLSWCDGHTLREAARRRPGAAFQIGMACGREQARLHETPAPPSLASTSWLTRFGPVDPELLERLKRVEGPPRLLHLDCSIDNVLVARGEVTGLIDWTNACAGDGRADLARTWSLLPRRFLGGARMRAAALLWRLVSAGWQRGYEQVAGSQRDMLLFRIWALTGVLHSRGREEQGIAGVEHKVLQTRLAQMRDRAGLEPVPRLSEAPD